jgi:hypothetical protein
MIVGRVLYDIFKRQDSRFQIGVTPESLVPSQVCGSKNILSMDMALGREVLHEAKSLL